MPQLSKSMKENHAHNHNLTRTGGNLDEVKLYNALAK